MNSSNLETIVSSSGGGGGGGGASNNTAFGTLTVTNGIVTYPYYGYSTTYYSTAPFEVKKVTNGFIVKKYGTEYVFKTEAELCKWLTKELKAIK